MRDHATMRGGGICFAKCILGGGGGERGCRGEGGWEEKGPDKICASNLLRFREATLMHSGAL